MDWQDRITVDPKVLVGKPVIKGTRITVELIVEMMSQGAAEADVLAAYPHLKADDVRAALAYAAASLASDELVFLGERSS